MESVRGVNVTSSDEPKFIELIWQRPNFLALWVAMTISRIGDKLTQVALGVYALQLGHGAALPVAAVLMCSLAPHFLFGWVMGVIVDRTDKKRLMVICSIIRGALILTIPFVGRIDYVILVSFLAASLSALSGPAVTASIPETVKPRELLGANSLFSLSNAAIDVAGYALASVVIMAAGVKLSFALDFCTYMISAAIMTCITVSLKPVSGPRPLSTFIPDLKDGLRYHKESPTLNSLLVLVSVSCLAFGAINSLGLVAVDRLLRVPPESFGLLLSSQGVAMFLGSILMGRVFSRVLHKAQMVAIGFLILGLATVTIGINSIFAVAMVAYFFLGLGNILFLVPTLTWVQEVAPLELRGRLVSIRNVAINLALFISMGTSGYLADVVGVSTVLVAAGIMTTACALGPLILPGLWPRASNG